MVLGIDAVDNKIPKYMMIMFQSWRFVLGVGVISGIVSVAIAVRMPAYYDSTAVLYPKETLKSSRLQSGPLDAVAFLSKGLRLTPEISLARLAIEKARSLAFFTDHVYEAILPELTAVKSWDPKSNKLIFDNDRFDLVSRQWHLDPETGRSLKPSHQEAHKVFLSRLKIFENQQTTMITIEIRHISPYVAQQWLTTIIEKLNLVMAETSKREASLVLAKLEEKRRGSSLITVNKFLDDEIENAYMEMLSVDLKQDLVFGIIQPPVVPEKKSGPNRVLLCILLTMVGPLLSILAIMAKVYVINGPSFIAQNHHLIDSNS